MINLLGRGFKIKLMVMDRYSVKMEASLKACGQMICSMGKVLKHGMMALYIRDNIKTVESMDKGNSRGIMVLSMLANGCKTRCMEMVYLIGLMDVISKENGKKTK